MTRLFAWLIADGYEDATGFHYGQQPAETHVGTFRQSIPARGCEAHPAGSPVNAGPDVHQVIAAKGGKGGFNHIGGNNV